MAPRYQVRLKSPAGVLAAVFDDFRRLQYTHRVNYPGSSALTIDGKSPKISEFELDSQLEVWRRDPENNLDWYLEWEGLYRTGVRQTDGSGKQSFTAYCTSYLELLSRRIIAAYSGTARAEKTGVGGLVIYDYVDENAGTLATLASGRILEDGTTQGLAMLGPRTGGLTWSGGRAYKNLLDVIQGIANDTGVDFDIVGTGAAAYGFTIYPLQRGIDRSLAGYDPTTGRNGVGVAPVTFALEFGNMAIPVYALARTSEVTSVFVLGKGEGTSRTIVVRNDVSAMNDSPWNRREIARNATNETLTAALESVGDQALSENQAKESFTFDVLQLPALFYGKHYSWGDKVIARYGDIERTKRIVAVAVSVAPNDNGPMEQVSVDFADVP